MLVLTWVVGQYFYQLKSKHIRVLKLLYLSILLYTNPITRFQRLVREVQNYISIQLNLCKTTTLKNTKNGFPDQILLNAGQSSGSILQYFRPSLSYNLSLRYSV